MPTTTKVTKAQAEQALAAVVEQFKIYTEPMELEAEVIDGKAYPARTLSPCCPLPTLVEDYAGEGVWAICWEEGPDDWAFRASSGGYSETEYVTQAEAAKEFGFDPLPPKQEEPVKFPEGIYGEPYFSMVLCLYPI